MSKPPKIVRTKREAMIGNQHARKKKKAKECTCADPRSKGVLHRKKLPCIQFKADHTDECGCKLQGGILCQNHMDKIIRAVKNASRNAPRTDIVIPKKFYKALKKHVKSSVFVTDHTEGCEIETWKSDKNEEEKHYFRGAEYLFGINSKLFPKETVDKIHAMLMGGCEYGDPKEKGVIHSSEKGEVCLPIPKVEPQGWYERFVDFWYERGAYEKRPLGIEQYIAFIEQVVREEEGLWRMAITHCDSETRESILATREKLKEHLANKTL